MEFLAPEDFAQRMAEIAQITDPEQAHTSKRVGVMRSPLVEMGYHKGVDIFTGALRKDKHPSSITGQG